MAKCVLKRGNLAAVAFTARVVQTFIPKRLAATTHTSGSDRGDVLARKLRAKSIAVLGPAGEGICDLLPEIEAMVARSIGLTLNIT